MDFDAQWLKYLDTRKVVPLGDPHDGRPQLGGQIPLQKPKRAWLGNYESLQRENENVNILKTE